MNPRDELLGRRKRLWNQEDTLCSGEEILTKERREFSNLLKILQEGKERSQYIGNSEEDRGSSANATINLWLDRCTFASEFGAPRYRGGRTTTSALMGRLSKTKRGSMMHENIVTHGRLPQSLPRPGELLPVVYMGREIGLTRPMQVGDAQDGVRATIKTMQLYKALTCDLEFKVVQELKLEAELGPSDGAT
ncbi:hypothetical protein VNO77_34509 [Canavalia gladiata]|uniref:Uncharacterized protein n=1 Tax=Canavalia gladiata TaxID=3824 RepID=A0AAN9KEE7_CANGL